MRKTFSLLLAVAMLLSLCSCSKNNTANEPNNTSGANDVEVKSEDDILDSIADVEADKGIMNVTLTVPADFVGTDVTQEDLDQSVQSEKYKSATLNSDGSVTYVMSKKQHQELIDSIRQTIGEGLSELVSSGDYPNVTNVEANDDFTKYEVTITTEEVGLSDGFMTMALYLFSGMYHVFNGTEPGNINVQYVNAASGTVIHEANSKDME